MTLRQQLANTGGRTGTCSGPFRSRRCWDDPEGWGYWPTAGGYWPRHSPSRLTANQNVSRAVRIYVYARIRVYVHVYTSHICFRVYAYKCPCARANAVSGLLFREGGLFPNIVSSRLQHADSAYNQQAASICGAQWGPPVSTDYTQVNVYVHSVYKLCTVSTNYAQCLQTMHSVYKLCAVTTNYAQ